MSRARPSLTIVSLALTALVAFLVGATVAGGPPQSATGRDRKEARTSSGAATPDRDSRQGTVLIELNRISIRSARDYRRVSSAAKPGNVVMLYLYDPTANQHQLTTLRVEDR